MSGVGRWCPISGGRRRGGIALSSVLAPSQGAGARSSPKAGDTATSATATNTITAAAAVPLTSTTAVGARAPRGNVGGVGGSPVPRRRPSIGLGGRHCQPSRTLLTLLLFGSMALCLALGPPTGWVTASGIPSSNQRGKHQSAASPSHPPSGSASSALSSCGGGDDGMCRLQSPAATGSGQESASFSPSPSSYSLTKSATRPSALKASKNYGSSTAVVEPEVGKWWEADADRWISIHDVETWHSLLENDTDSVFLVDFYGTWCSACKATYPELCKMAKDPNITKRGVKFVKLCIDELRVFAADLGVAALPTVQLWRDGKKLAGFQVPLSRLPQLKKNLEYVLSHRNFEFSVDPNGFLTGREASNREASQAKGKLEEVERKQEAAKLEKAGESLFQRLMQVANPQRAAPSNSGKAAGTKEQGASPLGLTPLSSPSANYVRKGADGSEEVVKVEVDVAAKELFVRQHPGYGYGGRIDSVYLADIATRMSAHEHYMDYTGSALYTNSQLDAVFADLKSHVFGNPHSDNPSSKLSSWRVEASGALVLKFFNADPTEYSVVFTRSATASLKMVGELFPWSNASEYRYLRESHNSVLGIREYALAHSATYHSVSEDFMDRWLHRGVGDEDIANDSHLPDGQVAYSIMAFPAEDNFAGVKYPLTWIREIQNKSSASHRWKVLLDAAAFVPTQPLDLAQHPADFVVMSFYKMFGYPTGLGALLIKNDVVPLLKKEYWGGGSVSLATSGDDFHVLQCRPSDRLEDGTLAFLDIVALTHGFTMLDNIGGIKAVQAHVSALTDFLYSELMKLKHSNGRQLLQVFGKHDIKDEKTRHANQGGIVNFLLLKPDGQTPYSYRKFQKDSAAAGFHIRTGAECNPGACYAYLDIAEEEVETLAGLKEGCDDELETLRVARPTESAATSVTSNDIRTWLQGSKVQIGHPSEVAMAWVQKPLGTVRASLGWMSTFEDCLSLVAFIRDSYTDRQEP